MKIKDSFSYVLIGALVAFVVFTISVWLPNFQFVSDVLFRLSGSFIEKLSLLGSLYGGIETNFTSFSALYTIAIAVLFGLNVSLLVFLIRQRRKASLGGVSVAGIGGFVSGIFGVGCAACGTFVLTSVLSLIGGGALLTALPLGGEEFGILGLLLLGYTTYTLLKKIQEPLVCEV